MNIARVPNLLSTRIALSNLTRTNLSLFTVQSQLATGRLVNRPSDDPVRATMILTLDSRLERAEQRLKNLDHATSSLNGLDAALAEVSDMILEAKSIASEQSNVGSSASEKRNQALVIQSLLDGLFQTVNRSSISGHMFGGTTPGTRPVESFLSGYRYVGEGTGLVTDLGLGTAVPVTLGRGNPIAGVSARVHGTVGFDLDLTPDTRLDDLRGGRGLGVSSGTVEFSFDGLVRAQVDLTGADTVADVLDALRAAIQSYEQTNGVTILGAGGVSITGGAITIDVAPDTNGGPDPTLRFYDQAGGVTAADLGLTATGATAEFSAAFIVGIDLDPTLTWRTSTGLIDGQALGSIRIENAGQVRVIDLSGAQTFGDVKNLIEGADIGVRVEINAGRDGIDVVNEVSAGRVGAMSISGISAGDTTAERLGIRSFSAMTRVTDFNFGAGVEVLSGRSDPLTGQPDPMLDRDFRVTLGNGRTFDVDLRPSDMVTVGTIIARINAQASSQGMRVPEDFQAALSPTSNGIAFTQDGAFAQPIQIAKLNDSPALSQLGLKDGARSNGGATITSSDRSKVRVSSVFSDLLDLHGALMSNDTFGITFAAEHLEQAVDRVSQARALVGGFTNRVTKAIRSQEDQALLDQQIRSEMRDLDFAEAAVRLNLLQTQLMASLQTTAMMGSRTLLDFLG